MTTELPRRPVIDPNDPVTMGVHLQYMAIEVHTISDTLKEMGRAIGDLQRTMPLTYASSVAMGELSRRVDKLESDADIARGAAPTYTEVAKTVARLELAYERMRGGQQWLWGAYGILVGLAGLAITAFKLWQG